MFSISIKVDTSSADRYLKRLAGPQGVSKAIERAINRAATSVKEQAAREIFAKRNLKLSTIRQAIRIRRASAGNLEARVIASGASISIRHFSRINKRSITAQVARNSKRVLLQAKGNRAFVNPRIGGGVTPFVRVGKSRLPIRAWSRVSGIPKVFMQKRIEQLMRETAATVFQQRLRHELKFIVERAKR